MSINYKNYVLESASVQLSETKKWRPYITIINPKDIGGIAHAQKFHVQDTFNTKEEADAHSYNFGKEIIDGKHPDAKLTF